MFGTVKGAWNMGAVAVGATVFSVQNKAAAR